MSKTYSVRDSQGYLIAEIPKTIVFDLLDKFKIEFVDYRAEGEDKKKAILVKENFFYEDKNFKIYFWEGYKLIPNDDY